jgi:hypothetical protein
MNILEETVAFLREYRAADQEVRAAKFIVCMLEALKWDEIRKGIIKIETEEADRNEQV